MTPDNYIHSLFSEKSVTSLERSQASSSVGLGRLPLCTALTSFAGLLRPGRTGTWNVFCNQNVCTGDRQQFNWFTAWAGPCRTCEPHTGALEFECLVSRQKPRHIRQILVLQQYLLCQMLSLCWREWNRKGNVAASRNGFSPPSFPNSTTSLWKLSKCLLCLLALVKK